MNFGDSIKSGFNRYFDFNTRSSRSEYWWWYLFTALVGYALMFFGGAMVNMGIEAGLMLPFIWYLGVIIPTLALSVRRLHDTDRSGWWFLIAFTGIGALVLLFWFVTRGTEADNDFGADPLGVEEG